jgi:hypothetical protein
MSIDLGDYLDQLVLELGVQLVALGGWRLVVGWSGEVFVGLVSASRDLTAPY